MNIGIVGVGAVGSFIVSQLLAKHNLFYFNRSDKILVEITTFDKHFKVPIVLSTSGQNKTQFDWLVVCVKEYQTSDIINEIKVLINPETKLAIIRNGMQLKEPFVNLTSKENILPVIFNCSIQPGNKNIYRQKSSAKIILPAAVIAEEFHDLLSDKIIEFDYTKDFHSESWKKLIESSALGGVMAITKRSCEVFEESQYLSMFQKLISEGIEVAKADGANIPFYFFNELKNKLNAYPKNKGSSMLTDVLNGRQIEFNAKNGFIVKRGLIYGIATPVNEKVLSLLG